MVSINLPTGLCCKQSRTFENLLADKTDRVMEIRCFGCIGELIERQHLSPTLDDDDDFVVGVANSWPLQSIMAMI